MTAIAAAAARSLGDGTAVMPVLVTSMWARDSARLSAGQRGDNLAGAIRLRRGVRCTRRGGVHSGRRGCPARRRADDRARPRPSPWRSCVAPGSRCTSYSWSPRRDRTRSVPDTPPKQIGGQSHSDRQKALEPDQAGNTSLNGRGSICGEQVAGGLRSKVRQLAVQRLPKQIGGRGEVRAQLKDRLPERMRCGGRDLQFTDPGGIASDDKRRQSSRFRIWGKRRFQHESRHPPEPTRLIRVYTSEPIRPMNSRALTPKYRSVAATSKSPTTSAYT